MSDLDRSPRGPKSKVVLLVVWMPVFEAVAIVGEERVVALRIILLHAGEILVGGFDEIGAAHTFRLWNIVFPNRLRDFHCLQRLDARRWRGIAAEAWHDRFDFADLAIGDLDARCEIYGVAILAHRRKHGGVTAEGIDEIMFVAAEAANGAPDTIAEHEFGAVLGIANANRLLQLRKIMRNEGV